MLVAATTAAADYGLSLTVDTGFFERSDALVSVELAPPVPLNLCGATLRMQDAGAPSQPFWFEPDGKGGGTLYWVLGGETDSLVQIPYFLRAPAGPPPAAPCGEASVKQAVRNARNLLPNGSFENLEADPPKPSTIWHGERQPEEWQLHDYAWRDRNLPDLKSTCRVTDEEALDGKNSIRFTSELRADSPQAAPDKPLLVIGYIYGPTVPIKPSTRYEFSYYVKITEVERGGYISASVNYLDTDRERLYPRQYAINRLQTAYGTTRNLPDEYMNRWVRVTHTGTTLPDAAFGRIEMSGSLAGTVYVDRMVLRELPRTEPVQVIKGDFQPLQEDK
jgi:hypothetical protein